MKNEDFDWSSESVAVERVDAIAVYRNVRGDVVIRQQHPTDGDDGFVVLSINRLPDLLLALQNELP